jgi:lysophospholipase L1-like esterase
MPGPYRRAFIGDFEQSQKDHPNWPVVIAEGDSWFSFADVIGQLDDPQDKGNPKFQRPWALLRLEKAGDEVMTILSGVQRAQLRKYFDRWKLDALLFSGGGNDIIGPDLLPLLRDFTPGCTAQDLVQRSRFERRIRQIQDCYRELLDLLDDAQQPCKVFVNSYDYIVPSNKGAELLFGAIKVSGPWVLPHFESRNIPPPLQKEVIQLLIDNFSIAIDQVAAEPRGMGRIARVETRNVVKGEWKDEIHPNRKGAIRVGKVFEGALKAAGVIT